MDRSSLDEQHLESRSEYSPSRQRETFTRTLGFAALSIVLALALVIDLMVPDPYPVVDELILLIAASVTGFLALRNTM